MGASPVYRRGDTVARPALPAGSLGWLVAVGSYILALPTNPAAHTVSEVDRAPILHVFNGARLAQPQQTRMSLCGWMSLQADALRLGQPRSTLNGEPILSPRRC